MKRTKLVQKILNNSNDIDEQFNSHIENDEIIVPVVLVPRWSPFRFHLQVPSKGYAIIQKFGKDIPPQSIGSYFKPPWYRVAFLVTTEALTYTNYFLDCKTKDFVSLGVEVMVAFKVTDAPKFVYHIGVTQFDDLLATILEYATRLCVSNILFDVIKKR